MREYDPNLNIDPMKWGSLDDDQKLQLVEEYHEQFDPDLPDLALHSVLHTIVENQIALGDETPAAAALARVESEGLDRHDAVHAIASVLVSYRHEMLGASDTKNHNDQYFEALTKLTAESWRSQT
jgi:hypothetical protein